MAMEPKTKKIILISVGILALLGLAYLIYKLAQPADVPVVNPDGTTTTTKPGILDTLTKQYCNLFPSSKICGGSGNQYVTTGCDPERPGYNLDGLYDNNCQ